MNIATRLFVRLNITSLKRLNIARQSRRLVFVRRILLGLLQCVRYSAHRFRVISIFDLEGHCLAIDVDGFLLNVCVFICRSNKKSKVVGAVLSDASVDDVDAEFFSSGLNCIHFIFRSELPKVVVGYVAFAARMDKKRRQVRQGTTHFGSPIMRLASGSRA